MTTDFYFKTTTTEKFSPIDFKFGEAVPVNSQRSSQCGMLNVKDLVQSDRSAISTGKVPSVSSVNAMESLKDVKLESRPSLIVIANSCSSYKLSIDNVCGRPSPGDQSRSASMMIREITARNISVLLVTKEQYGSFTYATLGLPEISSSMAVVNPTYYVSINRAPTVVEYSGEPIVDPQPVHALPPGSGIIRAPTLIQYTGAVPYDPFE